MASTRQQRISEILRVKLSELLLLEINDPRLSGVTVTEVTIDRELSYANIYVNALGEEERKQEVLTALERASGFMRHKLSKTLDLRKVPELRFEWDSAFEYAEHIEELLDSLDLTSSDDQTESAEDSDAD